MRRFRKECIACGARGVPMNREHFWPEWLIELTRTAGTPIGWIPGHKVPPRTATIPICEQCNADFGRELEGPTACVFRDVLAGR